MRLLDLASARALERRGSGSDSQRSWSGSEDTMNLGMSCSGVQGSPETRPVFEKVQYNSRQHHHHHHRHHDQHHPHRGCE
jgi:hypothetical protein